MDTEQHTLLHILIMRVVDLEAGDDVVELSMLKCSFK